MSSDYFYILSVGSAILGSYCSFRAWRDKGSVDLGNTAILLLLVSVLSYGVAFGTAPRHDHYEEMRR